MGAQRVSGNGSTQSDVFVCMSVSVLACTAQGTVSGVTSAKDSSKDILSRLVGYPAEFDQGHARAATPEVTQDGIPCTCLSKTGLSISFLRPFYHPILHRSQCILQCAKQKLYSGKMPVSAGQG